MRLLEIAENYAQRFCYILLKGYKSVINILNKKAYTVEMRNLLFFLTWFKIGAMTYVNNEPQQLHCVYVYKYNGIGGCLSNYFVFGSRRERQGISVQKILIENMWITVVIVLAAIYIIVSGLLGRAGRGSRASEGPQPPEYPGALPVIGHGHLFSSANSDSTLTQGLV